MHSQHLSRDPVLPGSLNKGSKTQGHWCLYFGKYSNLPANQDFSKHLVQVSKQKATKNSKQRRSYLLNIVHTNQHISASMRTFLLRERALQHCRAKLTGLGAPAFPFPLRTWNSLFRFRLLQNRVSEVSNHQGTFQISQTELPKLQPLEKKSAHSL